MDTFTLRPSVCFEVQKITAVSIGEGNRRNYQVQWAPTWISSVHLVGCEHLIEEFICQQSEEDKIVENKSTPAVTDMVDVHDDLTDNVPDSGLLDATYRHRAIKEICKRASMVVKDDHMLKNLERNSSNISNESHFTSNLYSKTTNDNGNVKVLALEKDMSNGDLSTADVYDSNKTNPNFEWASRSTAVTYSDRVDNSSQSISLYNGILTGNNAVVINDAVANSNIAAGNILSDAEGEDVRAVGLEVQPMLNLNNEYINNGKLATDKGFQESLFKVKEEEIIVVERQEIDEASVLQQDNMKKCNPSDRPASKYECKICYAIFKNNSALTKHSVKCGTSDRTFSSEVSPHQYRTTRTTACKCHVCKKMFLDNNSLQEHMIIHLTQRSQQCSFCGKMFLTCSKLKEHERVHTNERPYHCEVCKKSFKRKEHLMRHIRTHREMT